MKRFSPAISVFLLMALLLFGCVKRPKGVLSDDEMAPVVADLELAEAYMQTNGGKTDVTKDALMAYVLEKHGVSRADFDTTMAWYGRNVDDYRKLYKNVDRILMKERKRLAGASGGAEDMNANDIWAYRRFAVISQKGESDALTFSIPTSRLEKGDRIVWKFRIRNLAEARALLGVEYSDGTNSFMSRKVNPSRSTEMTFQTDSSLQVKRIYGNLHFPESRDLPVWLDSISLTHLPFDSLEYYKIHGQRVMGAPYRRLPKPAETDSVADEETRP